MFGERPVVGTGRADLAKAYPSAWRAWIGRKVDKALSVRLAWVESTRGILCNHPELRRELEGMFRCTSRGRVKLTLQLSL
jgi:sister-chromatid-cohesion protein PDS5